MGTIKQKVHEARIKIAKLEEEIKELQNACTHQNTERKMIMYRPSSSNVCEVCTDCGYVIPNIEDLYWSEYEK